MTQLQGQEVQDQPVAGIDAALQGKAAGVQVTQNSGEPGNGISVRVRGAASLSASNQPLYVVDGVPIAERSAVAAALPGGQRTPTAITGTRSERDRVDHDPERRRLGRDLRLARGRTAS